MYLFNYIAKIVSQPSKFHCSVCTATKRCCFKVDIHLMPDLPTSDPEKDWAMFQEVLFGPDLQADHWKIYPCSVQLLCVMLIVIS